MLPSPSSATPPYPAQDPAPRGLTAAQQREIATAQAQAASMDRPYRPSNRPFPSSASLYVGELDPSVQESTLYEIFSQYGPLESVRVCRDAITQRSLGYAFVNFKTHVDGERALHMLNYTMINGKPCRIMWSQRDLAKRKASGGNIFVRNLDPSVTTKSLHDTFAQYGSIVSCKVVTDVNGQSKGYGFVNYDTIEAAENAIQHANGTTVYDRELFVGHHIPKRERQQHRIEEAKKKFTNVYVKNLMPDIKEEELKELFAGFGPIVSVLIQRDEAGNSKGFGFVNFERHEDAERAVQQMNDTEYIGRRLYVSRAQKRSEREERHHSNSEHYSSLNYLSPTTTEQHHRSEQHHHLYKPNRYQGMNVYIKYLDDQVDDQRLREEFSKFGTITSAKVMRDENGKSKGYGFVCFSSPQEAIKAVNDMNGRILSTKAIYVALAQKREDRRPSHHIDAAHHPMAPRTNQLHLQQPFIPAMPVSSYVTSGPVYYDYAAYPPDVVSPSPGRPHRGWTHASQPAPAAAAGAPPPPMAPYVKPGYPVHIPYVNYVGPPPPQQHGTRPSMYTPPMMDTNPVRNAPDASQTSSPRPGSAVVQADKETNDQESPHHHQPLTLESISSYPEETQNQILGERVYAVVHRTYPELAGKVTGMLLEMDKEDLITLINDPPMLESKANEAVVVLEQHRANQPEDD